MKVIFLDVDGVLNYAGTDARAPSGCLGVASEPVKHLSTIVQATGAKIVLVSTWKEEWHFEEELCSPDALYLSKKLKRRGLHIMDKTRTQVPDRGLGIKEWLDKRPNVTDWIVLDDDMFPDYEEYGIAPHMVATHFVTGGLKEEHVQKCIELLGGVTENEKQPD